MLQAERNAGEGHRHRAGGRAQPVRLDYSLIFGHRF
jgi:hypothetical protein